MLQPIENEIACALIDEDVMNAGRDQKSTIFALIRAAKYQDGSYSIVQGNNEVYFTPKQIKQLLNDLGLSVTNESDSNATVSINETNPDCKRCSNYDIRKKQCSLPNHIRHERKQYQGTCFDEW